jgi:NAD+ synthase
MRAINIEKELERIIQFTQDKMKRSGVPNIIVGLSGGIDSALTAFVSVKALGKAHVRGVMLPYKSSHPDSLAHAKLVAEALDIPYEVIDISPMVDAYFQSYDQEASPLRKGNFMARTRMCTLFDLSSKYSALVAGTSNKSELYVGYCTQYGDSACAFEPIGHLYKTEVREMSRFLGVPEPIILKKSTADLWAGQTDEDELGITYQELDEILYHLIDLNKEKKDLMALNIKETSIDLVIDKIAKSEFKRQLPDILDELWQS